MATPRVPPHLRKKTGRPSNFTQETLAKLDEVFAIGASDLEACFYAGVSPAALYNYQLAHPEFVEHKELLKKRPYLMARRTVVKAAGHNPEMALKYLERKHKDEFSLRTEHTGAGGGPILISEILDSVDKPEEAQAE